MHGFGAERAALISGTKIPTNVRTGGAVPNTALMLIAAATSALALLAPPDPRLWDRVAAGWDTRAETDPMHDERAILAAALAERARAPRGAPSGPAELALFRYIAPPVQVRVYRTLRAHASQWLARDAQRAVEDLVQHVLCGLFEGDARALRAWDPSRPGALSLRGWVGRFASLRVLDQISVRKQFDWMHVPSEPEAMERGPGTERPDASVEAGQLWDRIRREVLAEQSELGQRLFALLIEEDLANAELPPDLGLSDDALYQWRRRLRVETKAAWLRLWGAS